MHTRSGGSECTTAKTRTFSKDRTLEVVCRSELTATTVVYWYIVGLHTLRNRHCIRGMSLNTDVSRSHQGPVTASELPNIQRRLGLREQLLLTYY